MLIVYIGGDDAVRRFFSLRRHCPLYEEKRGKWTTSSKQRFLGLPPHSFVALDGVEEIDPEDGEELSCFQMRNVLRKSSRLKILTSYASRRDHEIAQGLSRKS